MVATSSLSKKLASKYPHISFQPDNRAHWAPALRTVFYCPDEPHADWILLHETAHGILNHQDYSLDIELLQLERDAWHHATTVLAPDCGITIDPDFVESHLDTYRDWLHTKSTCPHCHSNGIEQSKHYYLCLHCHGTWRTNTGVTTNIRRYTFS